MNKIVINNKEYNSQREVALFFGKREEVISRMLKKYGNLERLNKKSIYPFFFNKIEIKSIKDLSKASGWSVSYLVKYYYKNKNFENLSIKNSKE